MEPTGKTVVVVGATGLQGQAVTRRLLSNGWQVRALSRNPDGVPANAQGTVTIRTNQHAAADDHPIGRGRYGTAPSPAREGGGAEELVELWNPDARRRQSTV